MRFTLGRLANKEDRFSIGSRNDCSESMGQQDIYEFLKEHPGEWFTSGEIRDALNLSIGTVAIALKRLRETDEVRYQRIKGPGMMPYLYMFME